MFLVSKRPDRKAHYKCKYKLYKRSKQDELLYKIRMIVDEITSFQANILVRQISLLHKVQNLHKDTFGAFKNKFADKNVVLLATGPSLTDFIPIKDAIYVGVNGAFKYDKIKLDYLFMEDFSGLTYIEEAAKYNCTKFYGINRWEYLRNCEVNPIENWLIPEDIALRHGAKRFYSEAPWLNGCINPSVPFAYDLTSEPLYCYGSIVFLAMQFILWTNPKKVYLVGCDCSNSGRFNDGQANPLETDYVINHWQKMKEFLEKYYPDIEIISVNPVGLKGLFKDVYTQSYLEVNPNLTKELGDDLDILYY